MKAADEATKEVEAATQTSKSAAEKDKYKQLARRLKEERNNFRFVCVDFCTIYRFPHITQKYVTDVKKY